MEDPASAIDDLPGLRRQLMLKALEIVPFEGWHKSTLEMACRALDIEATDAMHACPGGVRDLVVEFQEWGDELMVGRLEELDLASMRMRDRIALAVKTRLEMATGYREVVRQMLAFFALPVNGQAGARALWHTSDRIWVFLGDQSDDINWYSKRATLSAVLASSVLYWLGDSGDGTATGEFVDRRIDNVMQLEKLKSGLRRAPGGTELMIRIDNCLRFVRPPAHRPERYPGWLRPVSRD